MLLQIGKHRPNAAHDRTLSLLRIREYSDATPRRLAWCDLQPQACVAVARIPPVVPYAGLDDDRLALMKNAGLFVALRGQLTLEHGELLDKRGVAMFPHDTRSNERGQLGGRATAGLSQGRTRIVARSLVTAFSQTSGRAVLVRHATNPQRLLTLDMPTPLGPSSGPLDTR